MSGADVFRSPLAAHAGYAEEARMDFFDIFASLFSAGTRPTNPVERAIKWAATIGIILACVFLYLVFAGF